MPTSYSDQFFTIDPYSPPPVGTPLTFSIFTLTDQNDDNDFDRFDNDSIDGSDITSSWPGDTVTVNVPGVGNVTYTGVTFYLADGRQVFTPNDAQVLQNGTLVSASGVTTQGPLTVAQMGPSCFTPGTLIDTPDGPRRIELLQPGDMVITRDNGEQPVMWIGSQQVRAEDRFAPVHFAAGALGNDLPLLVSPQHRMLIEDWRAVYYMGDAEVFAAACHLVNSTTVTRRYGGVVEYIHLLFRNHEVIFSNGVPSESYFPDCAVERADRDARAEILALFPDCPDRADLPLQTARPVVRAHEAKLISACALS